MHETTKAPDWGKAPASGWILAVTEEGKTVFDAYTRDGSDIRLSRLKLPEGRLICRCHCFDESTEYRYLSVGDERRVIETLCDAKQEAAMDPDLLYEDDLIVSEQFAPDSGIWKLRVINRYRYTDFNTLTVDDYRLGGIYRD